MGTPRAAFSLLFLLAPALAGCGMLPRDRMDTLERLRDGGELRVGAAAHPPWVSRENGRYTGLAESGTAAGVIGVGLGFWWMDPVAAAIVSTSILKDGVQNVGSAIADLIERRPMKTP